MSTELSMICPVYNSEAFLLPLVKRIKSVFDRSSIKYEVIFVDDGSRDSSPGLLKKIHKKDKRFKYLLLERNFGQHNAILAGLNLLSGKYVVTMDADLQHPPEGISKLVDELKNDDCDLVYARFPKKRHGIVRNIFSEIHYLLPLITSCRRIKITSFRAIKRKTAVLLAKSINPSVNLDALILRFLPKIRIGFVQVEHQARKSGKSGYNSLKLIKFALQYFSSYYFPYKRGAPQYKIKERCLS